MIDSTTIHQLSQKNDLRYARYAAPMTDIYLLGDDSALTALVFDDSWPADDDISKWFKKGSAESVSNALRALDEYFHGPGHRRKAGDAGPRVTAAAGGLLRITMHGITLTVDLSRFTAREISVYRELLKVPAGAVISYGALARNAGIPGGARFVGNTMAKNRFPVVIPCHRVIRSDGAMGNYSGGTHIKKYLLDFEKKGNL